MMIRKPVSGNHTIFIQSLDELERFAIFLSQNVSHGDFIALTGGLGTGKTTFTQLFCKALGITDKVTSPTFTLLNQYESPSHLILHGDLYRLEDIEINAVIEGVIETAMFYPQHTIITLMEWAEKSPELEWSIHLDFQYADLPDGQRHITISTQNTEQLTSLKSFSSL